MKIVQINKFFYRRAGAETYFLDLSEALTQAGHQVSFFAMKHPQNLSTPYEKYFVDEIDFSSGAKKSLSKAGHFIYSTDAARKMRELIRAEKPDIAHVHNLAHQLTPSILDVLREEKIPVVMTLHDYQVLCPNYKLFTKGSPCERCKVHKYWNAVLNNCVQDSKPASALSAIEMTIHNVLKKSYKHGVQRFIAPSQFMYNKMHEWGWTEDQLAYIPHFIDRMRDNRITKKNQVAYIGRLTKEKGVHLVIDAARKNRTIDFVFAGWGEEEKAIKNMIETEQLTHCSIRGFLNEHEVNILIQESQAVLVPSIWWENAPFSVYEPLALGTPVIASNRGGLPELIEEGKNGYIFDPEQPNGLGKAIEKLQQTGPLQIGENRYNRGSHIETLLQLYEDEIRQYAKS